MKLLKTIRRVPEESDTNLDAMDRVERWPLNPLLRTDAPKFWFRSFICLT